MRILFLAPSYQNLYEPILNELRDCGNEVVFIEDVVIPGDHYRRASCFVWECYRSVKRWISKKNHKFEKYWKKKINSCYEFSSGFDVLFVINGCSFHPYLLEHLKTLNKDIRSVLYIWDTSRFYNYQRNFQYFDKVATFDLDDARLFSIRFLPFYWTECKECLDTEYKLSIVGTNHDGRLSIVSSIAEQLDKLHITNYKFCIYSERRCLYLIEKIQLLFAKVFGNTLLVEEFGIISGACQSKFVINQHIPYAEVNRIISKSEIVLDTDRAEQTGTTPRVIWALAKGKRIISTNENLMRMPFYSPETISIIDRNNPVIDGDFLLNNVEVSSSISPFIENLRIDKWLQSLLY